MKPKKLESKLNFKLPKRLLLKLKLTKKLPMPKLPKKLPVVMLGNEVRSTQQHRHDASIQVVESCTIGCGG